jgi:competence protein ComEA
MKLTSDQKYGLLFVAAILLFFTGEQIITGLFFKQLPADFHKSDSLFFALSTNNISNNFPNSSSEFLAIQGDTHNTALRSSTSLAPRNNYYRNKKQPLTEKININTASKDELIRLPNIGPKTAEKIIEYRNRHGKFLTIEDIKQIKGIGEKRFQALRDFIVVD